MSFLATARSPIYIARRNLVSSVLLTRTWENESVAELKRQAKIRGIIPYVHPRATPRILLISCQERGTRPRLSRKFKNMTKAMYTEQLPLVIHPLLLQSETFPQARPCATKASLLCLTQCIIPVNISWSTFLISPNPLRSSLFKLYVFSWSNLEEPTCHHRQGCLVVIYAAVSFSLPHSYFSCQSIDFRS
jgi:hypothetical protein